MASKAKVNWRKIILSAVAHVAEEGIEKVHQALRKAMEKEGIHPSQVNIEEYDELTQKIKDVHAAL